MAICLTNKSVRLLGAYFQRKLPAVYSPEKEFEDIIRELYESALKDFKGKIEQVAEEEVSDEEVILQHMTVVPNLMGKYLLNSGLAAENPKIMKRVSSETANVFNAFKDSKEPRDILNLLGLYGKMVSGQPLTISHNNPTVKSSHTIPGFIGINFNFNTTKSQFSITDTDWGVKSNIEDPKYG
jgi:hypothetical protein